MTKIKIFTLAFLSLCTMALSAKDYKASMFGVKSDGITLNSRSIQKAIDYISENGGGRLVFYVGRYLTGSIQLKSNVTIQLEEGAVLVGFASIYDYTGEIGNKALISAKSQENIGITGKGVIDGQGSDLQDAIKTQIQKGYLKGMVAQMSPALISLDGCSHVTIEQINLLNACGDMQSYRGCKDLNITDVSVKNKEVEGSKGIFLSACDGVKLSGLFFETTGIEMFSAGTSKNVTVVNCINEKGKKITTKL